MPDTILTRSAIATLLADNTSNQIGPQDHRDQLISTELRYVKTITNADSPYTATDDDRTIEADASGGAITVNLPAAAGVTHRAHTIIKSDNSANAVTVDANSTELINGAETYALASQYDKVSIQCNGTKWLILG